VSPLSPADRSRRLSAIVETTRDGSNGQSGCLPGRLFLGPPLVSVESDHHQDRGHNRRGPCCDFQALDFPARWRTFSTSATNAQAQNPPADACDTWEASRRLFSGTWLDPFSFDLVFRRSGAKPPATASSVTSSGQRKDWSRKMASRFFPGAPEFH
jgi:hypothetical protein